MVWRSVCGALVAACFLLLVCDHAINTKKPCWLTRAHHQEVFCAKASPDEI